jgi:hypothetical protein
MLNVVKNLASVDDASAHRFASDRKAENPSITQDEAPASILFDDA